MGCGGPWGCCWFTGEGVSAGTPGAGASLHVVDPVSPRQAVACSYPGAGVHPLVCEAGLEVDTGCSWTGPGPSHVWVWSLPAGGWTRAPGSTGAGPCVPIQRLCWCEGLAVQGRCGLKDSSDSLSAGEGDGHTSLPAWLLGLRPPMLCVAGGQVLQVLGWREGPTVVLACSSVLGAGPAPSVAATSVLSPVSQPASRGDSDQPVGLIWLF